ncbi:DUF2752 domain-containing protein [Acetivibrio cellulolyticus]|uniref:DUF2752 domain-containing protein n=1 Tax=Acetivibrio cellulolyticus TaxID=35830 RepID=UPI0001E300DD
MKKGFALLLIIGSISLLYSLIFKRSICLFLNLTGIPCPSCGMTRAYVSLFRGNLSQAFSYHPLFLMPFVIIFIMHEKIRSNKKLYNGLIISLLVVIFGVYVARFAVLFPTKEPFVFFPGAILPRFFRLIKSIF